MENAPKVAQHVELKFKSRRPHSRLQVSSPSLSAPRKPVALDRSWSSSKESQIEAGGGGALR